MIEIRGLYNTALCYTSALEEKAAEQIRTVCDQEEFAGCRIRIMPDVHAGKGCTIGTTMTISDKVVPGMVGVDIGCGMETVRLAEREIDFAALDALIRREVPSGRNVRGGEHLFNAEIDLSELRCAHSVSLDWARRSIGTLGGGNHFIEIDRAENGALYLVVHSGSRYLGTQVCAYYQEQGQLALRRGAQERVNALIAEYRAAGRQREIRSALKELDGERVKRIPKDLAYVEGELFEDYIHDMHITQRFAALNRKRDENGETPFADGEAAGPEETEAPEETEIIEEEYTGVHILAEESEPEAEEPLPEDLPEELIEEQPEEPLPEPEPEEEIAAEPEPAVLPEIDLDELDFSDLGLTFTKKPAAPVMPAAPEEEPEEEAGETPEEPAENEEPLPLEPLYPEEVLPDDEPRRIESADEILGALLADAAAELLPEEEADKPAPPDAEEPAGEPADGAAEETADEAPAEPEPEMPEPEEPDGAEDVSEILPAEESFPEEAEEAAEAEEPAEEPEAEEEYEYEEIETRRPVSGGRAFAAVVVTIPMLAVWVLLFGLSLALGIVVLAIGAALLAAGVYLTGYVFNGAIVRMPDLLLTAGATLAAFALALLLLWTGISIAVAGCTLTVRLTRSIYRAILYPKKEEDADE